MFAEISTALLEERKFGVFVGLDGGHALDNKLALLRTYYHLGVRYVTLNSECSTAWYVGQGAEERGQRAGTRVDVEVDGIIT